MDTDPAGKIGDLMENSVGDCRTKVYTSTFLSVANIELLLSFLERKTKQDFDTSLNKQG